MGSKKVVLSGIYYPMAILRYIEFALQRKRDAGEIELFTIGPYTGNWIPWKGGMDLEARYATPPDMPLPQNVMNTGLPYAYIERQLPAGWKTDFWIHVDAGMKFGGRPSAGKYAVIGTDPHVLNYDQDREIADVFFCMQTPYQKAGDEYLPYGFDLNWHRPPLATNDKRMELKYSYDAALLGLHYQNRNDWVNQLKAHGLNVYYDLGPVFEQARQIYNDSLMILNWSSLLDLTARVFEGAALGNLVVCNEVPDLKKFFEPDKEIITFNTLEEAVEKVVHYSNSPMEALAIAQAGHNRAMGCDYSWDNRVGQVLDTLEAL